jgi:hypothetical protein
MASASDSGLNGFSMKPKGRAAAARLRIIGSPWALTNRLGISKRCLISMAAATPSLLFASRMSISTRLGRIFPASSIAFSAVAAGPTASCPNVSTTHSMSNAAQISSSTIRIFCVADVDARRPRSERGSSRSQMPAVRGPTAGGDVSKIISETPRRKGVVVQSHREDRNSTSAWRAPRQTTQRPIMQPVPGQVIGAKFSVMARCQHSWDL